MDPKIELSALTPKERVKRLVTTALLDVNMTPKKAYAKVANDLGIAESTVRLYYYQGNSKKSDKATKSKVAHKPSSVNRSLTQLEKTAAELILANPKEADRIFTREFTGDVRAKMLAIIN